MPRKRQTPKKSILEKIEKIIPVNKPAAYKYVPPEEKERKKTLLKLGVIVAVVIVIATGALLLSFFTKPHVKTDIPVPHVTKPNVTESCDDNCFWLSAQKTSRADDCEKIANNTKKQLCFAALAENSIEACKQVSEYTEQKNCLLIHVARTKDIALCSLLNEADTAGCILNGDPCYYTNETEKPLCRALNNKNASFCGGDTQCIFTYSKQANTTAGCNAFSTRPLKNACISIVLRSDQCTYLPSNDETNYCKQLYAIGTNQSNECRYIQSNTVYAVECFAYFAEQTKQVSICKGVEILKRWDCYKKYSDNTGDLSGCIGIDDFAPVAKEHCFINTGKKYGNPQACEYLTFDPGAREVCFRAAIQDNTVLRSARCANLTNEAWSLRCYTNAAKLEKDIAICNKLQKDADVLFCRSNYK